MRCFIVVMAPVILFAAAAPARPKHAPPPDPAPRTAAAAPSLTAEERERAAILAARLPEYRRIESPTASLVTGGLEIAFGTAGGVILAVSRPEVDAGTVAFGGASATFLAGGIATFLVPEAYRRDTANSTLFAGMSALVGYVATLDETPGPGIAVSVGYGATAALTAMSMAIRPPTSPSIIGGHYESIQNPERRSRLRRSDLALVEKSFEGSVRPIPRPVLGLPLLVGGIVGVAWPAFGEGTAFGVGSALGLTAILSGLTYVFVPVPYFAYVEDLETAGLSLELAPGPAGTGLSLRGSF